MNDFTKTELRIIWMDMKFYASQSKPMNESPSHCELREKIEDMIESYCDHEWRSSAIDAIYCPHCQKHVECQL